MISGWGVWCQTGDIPVWQCWFLCMVFCDGTVNWLPCSAVMVHSWQMLHGDRSPTGVVVLISRRWWKYIHINRSVWHVCFMCNFFTWFAWIFLQQGADNNHRCVIHCFCWPPASQKRDAHCATVLWSITLSPQISHKALWIVLFPPKVSILMYDHWSLRMIWLQSVSSSISRLRFAEHGPHSLPICAQYSLLKSGSQLSWKSEWLQHLTGRASAVSRTFAMTYIYFIVQLKVQVWNVVIA